MSNIKYTFIQHGVQGEHEYESINEALEAAVFDFDNGTSAPVAIEQDAVVVYDKGQLYEYWTKKRRPGALQ